MPNTWKSDYLLNLVLVARADGVMKPIEVLYLSHCKNKLGANHRTLADAVMRSYWEDGAKCGEVLSTESALKDMITMALADGDISENERKVVARYIDAHSIPSARVESLMREAVVRFNLELKELEHENRIRMGKFSM